MRRARSRIPVTVVVVVFAALALLAFPSDTSLGAPEQARVPDGPLDALIFGDESSESAHDFAAETSRVFEEKQGGAKGRQLMPADAPEAGDKSLGSMSFTMECDPSARTYLTIKLAAPDSWNPKYTEKLMLFDGDDMVGYLRGRGAWPPLDYGMTRGRERGIKGTHSEYWYATHRLPRFMTKGKDSVDLRVVSWNAEGPSQHVYRAYTHTKPLFRLPPGDRDHNLDTGSVAGPSEDPMAPVVEKINRQVNRGQDRDPADTRVVHGLAVAYSRADWIDAVDKDAILDTVKSSIDKYAIEQTKKSHGEVFKRGWSPHGELGRAYTILHEEFKREGLLSEPLPNHPDGSISRRKAYTRFFEQGLEWRSRDRRPIYNQTIIVTVALVRMSHALQKLNPERAPEPADVDRWIDEAVGLKGMTHREGEKRRSVYLSGSYHMSTEAGMPKEAGYVSDYGSVGMRETAKLALETGLNRVKTRYQHMARARSHFRWFARRLKTGNRWCAIDAGLGRRQLDHPGRLDGLKGYGMTPFVYVRLSDDEVSRRWAELAIEHGVLEHRWPRLGISGLIYHVEGYRKLQKLEPSDYVLPMNRDKDLWTDPDMGLISITDGQARLMIKLNHSAGALGDDWGVNRVARVHYHGPRGDRLIMLDMQKVDFPFAGSTWERPNHLVRPSHFLGSNAKRNRYLPWKGEKGEVNQAMAGREVPQASRPNGEPWPGAERDDRNPRMPDPRVGMGVHYRELRIGPYLIGMNSTGAPERGFGPGKEYKLHLPDGVESAVDMSTGKKVTADTVVVQPQSTKILKVE